MLEKAQTLPMKPESLHVPAHPLLAPAEILHLHLLKFEHPKNEIAGGDLIAKALADLRDTERQLATHRRVDVFEIDEHTLSRLRPEIGDPRILLDRPDVRLKHQVKLTRLGE